MAMMLAEEGGSVDWFARAMAGAALGWTVWRWWKDDRVKSPDASIARAKDPKDMALMVHNPQRGQAITVVQIRLCRVFAREPRPPWEREYDTGVQLRGPKSAKVILRGTLVTFPLDQRTFGGIGPDDRWLIEVHTDDLEAFRTRPQRGRPKFGPRKPPLKLRDPRTWREKK